MTLENKHYGNVDAIAIAVENGDAEGFLAINVIKYVQRRNLKDSKISDIRKAFDYMSMLCYLEGFDKEELIAIIEERSERKWAK